MTTHYFNNSENRLHNELFGAEAFYDLDTTGNQAKALTKMVVGDICVVATPQDKLVRFSHFIFRRFGLQKDGADKQVQVLFGDLLDSHLLSKAEAAIDIDYGVLFDKKGNFKRASVHVDPARSNMIGERFFGEIPGVPVGSTFDSRIALSSAKVHRPTQAGISGAAKEGADSIVISGGYEDDQDLGDEIVYTGHGGQLNGKQVKDQEMLVGNLALVVSEMEGFPVRVVRGPDKNNSFSPPSGYRYDGLFRVDSHWHEIGKAGFKIWRYRLVKLQAEAVPPEISGVGAEGLPTGENSNPVRKSQTVQRIVRDTKQAKNVKMHYGHSCQVCGTRIMTATGPYAEAAHIRPLGAPHNGPDTSDNILCLCPNHHVMFDFGAFSIEDDRSLIGIAGSLSIRPGHRIDIKHLAFHREKYSNRAK